MTGSGNLSRVQRLQRRNRQRRGSIVALITALVVLASSGTAIAFFTGTFGGNAAARAGGLSAPTLPTATANSKTQITVGWTLPGTQLAGAQYQVVRTSGPGSPATVCTVTSSTTSCPDTPLEIGEAYGYSIVAKLSQWQTAAIVASTSTQKASPTLTNVLGGAGGTVGTAIPGTSITAAFGNSSGANAAGTITFKVSGPSSTPPSDCSSGTTVGTATVSGNGAYHSSNSFTPSSAGTYWWYASYGGDTHNNTATSSCVFSTDVGAGANSLTFNTAGLRTINVPAGVTAVDFTLVGAGGAGGAGASSAAGANGGSVSGTINISGGNPSGTTLTVVVGGGGSASGGAGAGATGCPGGGAGGTTLVPTGGGGGGAATCVYVSSGSPIAVAGGGGGGGAGSAGLGGAGSGTTPAAAGTAGSGGGSGGGGGTNTNGGLGGAGCGGLCSGASSSNTFPSNGGVGGSVIFTASGGGGGGGGYRSGGGGGGSASGGAGGGGGGAGFSGGQGIYTVSGASSNTYSGVQGAGGGSGVGGAAGYATFSGVGISGQASSVTFTQQPSSTATGGTPFAQQPQVTVKDSGNNPVQGVSVSMAASGGGLNCAAVLTNANGVAIFSGCSINTASGTPRTLTATAGGVNSAASTGITVSVGPPSKLAFTTQPVGAVAGSGFATQPKVTIQDAGGNTVTSATSVVSLAIGTNPGSGTLLGCTSSTSAGIASFSGCTITKVGTGYTLTATDAADGINTPSVPSSAFNMTAPTPSSITLAGASPTNATSVDYTVTFNAVMTGLTTSNFSTSATSGAISGASVTNVSAGPSATYTVTVNTGSGSGGLRLNVSNATGVTDTNGNALGGTPYNSGPSYTIDKTAPTGSNLDSSNGGSNTRQVEANDVVTFSFSEAMKASTIAAGLTAGSGSVTVTATLTDGGAANDTLSIPGVGLIDLGHTGYLASGSVNYTSSTLALNSGGTTLTLILKNGSASVRIANVGTTLKWTPVNTMTDLVGNAISTTQVSQSPSGQTNF